MTRILIAAAFIAFAATSCESLPEGYGDRMLKAGVEAAKAQAQNSRSYSQPAYSQPYSRRPVPVYVVNQPDHYINARGTVKPVGYQYSGFRY